MFFMLFIGTATARSPLLETIDVLEVSRSGRTLVLNRGHHESLQEGVRARLLLQTGTEVKPHLRTVGYAEVIKTSSSESYWYLLEVELAEAIRKGQRLVYLIEERSLEGKADWNMRQRRVILPRGKTLLDQLDERRHGMPKEMRVLDESQFTAHEIQHGEQAQSAYDITSENFDYWVQQKGLRFVQDYMQELEVLHLDRPERVSNLDPHLKQQDRAVFESYVQSVVRAINSSEQGLSSLYQRDMMKRDEQATQVRAIVDNHYTRAMKRRRESVEISPRAIDRIDRDGELWSADLEDGALRDFMIESGIASEERRQRLMLDQVQGHEFILRYSTSLDKFASEDDSNFQGVGYSLSLGYEYQLARLAQNLRSFTLEFEFRRSIAFYQVAPEVNGRFLEGNLGVALNYYFYNEPFSIRQLALYSGVSLKRGNGDAFAPALEEQQDYGYQFTVLPGIHFGAKYRFGAGDGYRDDIKIGLGLNFLYALENKRYNTVELPRENVAGSFTVRDNRFSVGMSFYF
jgi:hypothetical protein